MRLLYKLIKISSSFLGGKTYGTSEDIYLFIE
jgi:hypothetical protein